MVHLKSLILMCFHEGSASPQVIIFTLFFLGVLPLMDLGNPLEVSSRINNHGSKVPMGKLIIHLIISCSSILVLKITPYLTCIQLSQTLAFLQY